ncbi:hypothetical protein AAFF_G00073320 [Aldrovandia affinis]|uniref:Uncharacterized protein n=1 Tax=Aldrovandia affinis TaxID=143900 RepID=A0AAD7RYQ6_9TELE|nr:hypothetical protein AAFF_G00073320 [Aldrovandia affinis]
MKGISTNPEQFAVWIQSFDICSHLSKSLDEMYNDAEALDKTVKPNRHKEEGKGRRELDAEDRVKILRVLWENSHPLTTETTTLHHITNGQVADGKVNVQDALKIGQDMSTLLSSSLPGGFHAPISKKVVTMKFKPKGVKFNGKIICDLEALFARLLVVGSKRRMELSALFDYELGPVPASIINEYGCLRKGNKSVIVQCLGILVPNPHPPDVVLVDASQLIYHVVWPTSGTVADLAASVGRWLNRYITQTFVIFDRYEQVSAKDHKRQRRAKQYQLLLTTPLPSRDKVMKNKTNKRRLGELLCTHSIGDHIKMVSGADSIVTHDEADISLISYMLDAARRGATTIHILSDDTVFVLMVCWCWKVGITCHLQMERWDVTVFNINLMNLGEQCCSILAMHALSRCDTTSYPAGKGKVSALKAMRVVPGDLLHFIGEEGATDLQITEAVRGFFLALYNQRKSAPLNVARYDIYQKRKTPSALKTLPPTERNAHLHGRRAHLQVLLWKAADRPDPPAVDITKFGWDKNIMLVLNGSPVAPCCTLPAVAAKLG